MKTDLIIENLIDSTTSKMSSTYVPPHLRNGNKPAEREKPRYNNNRRRDFKPQWEAEKEAAEQKKREEDEKNLQNTEDNFPSLSSTVRNTRVWASTGKSFAQLASEWEVKQKKDEEQDALEKRRIEEYESRRRTYYNTPLPQFNNVGRYVEPEDENEETQQSPQKEDNDGWTLVDRKKVRKQKEIDLDDGESSSSSEPDDTVWNNDQPEEYETCWDDKRH